MDSGEPVQDRFGSRLFWRAFVVVNFVTVAWVVWLIWQLTPSAVVHDFVLRLPPPAAQSQTRASGNPQSEPSAAISGAGPAARTEILIQSGPPMTPLRLETEIKAPPKPKEPVTQGK